MSSRHRLQPAFILATLPQPLDSVHGRILASTVSSSSLSSGSSRSAKPASLTRSTGRRTKRSEIVVGIDGDGINIYSASSNSPTKFVHSSKPDQIEKACLLSSYALPPNTYFAAPPCSVFQKSSKHNAVASRFTYAAVKKSRDQVRTQVVCLNEELQQREPRNPKPLYHQLASASGVLSLHALDSYNLANGKSASHDVLILHEDGTANCFSKGLDKELWTSHIGLSMRVNTLATSGTLRLEYSQLIDLDAARKGLLRRREDILALLQTADSSFDSVRTTQLLFVISSSKAATVSANISREVHLFKLPSRSSTLNSSSESSPQHLSTWALPPAIVESSASQQRTTFSLHAANGILEQLSCGSIATYDFSGLVPRCTSILPGQDGPMSSFVRLSSSLILTCSREQYTIYDVNYNSVQAFQPFDRLEAQSSQSQKRKYSDSDASSSIPELIAHFPKAGTSIVLSGHQLLALQISMDGPSKKRRRIETFLIDSMGKGAVAATPAKEFDAASLPECLGKPLLPTASTPAKSTWSMKVSHLDKLIEDGDINEFEVLFAESVGIETNIREVRKASNKIIGRKEPIELLYKFSNAKHSIAPSAFREQAYYALGLMFAPELSTNSASPGRNQLSSSITVKLYAPNVFNWLALTGHLTADDIQKALEHRSAEYVTVSHGDVVTAIAAFDHSLSLVHNLLETNVHLDVEEIAKAVKVIIQSLDDSTMPQPDPRLIADLNSMQTDLGMVEAQLNASSSMLTNGSAPTSSHANSADQRLNHDADNDADIEMDELDYDIDLAIDTLERGVPIRGESLRQALTRLNNFPSRSVIQALRRNLNRQEIVLLIQILRMELANGGWTSRYISVGPDGSGTDDTGEPSDRAIRVIVNMLSYAVDALGMSGWLVSGTHAVTELLPCLTAEISATLEGIHETQYLVNVMTEFLRYRYKRQKFGYHSYRANSGAHRVLKAGKVWRVEKEEDAILPMAGSVKKRLVSDVLVQSGGVLHARSKREVAKAINRTVPKYSFEQIRI